MPKGEVTLLFTDVVGSSRLWETHGDGFIPIWQAHDAILRDAFARFGGFEVKTEGDAFMVAFRNPMDAIHCAVFAQAALNRYPWPENIGPIRVRMGIHCGDPIVHGSDYFGPVVNRAANTCKAAHGGQILATEETIEKAREALDPKIELHDLGYHRLKDMGAAQRIFEPRHVELDLRSFPPPRSLSGQPNNLPVQRTSFVGRAREIEQIAAYLAQGGKPLLTVTGPTGIGKTRLTLQAAATHSDWFPDGVWYVRLDHAHDVASAAAAIADAMGMPLSKIGSTAEQVRGLLADRRCLLILDDANSLPYADKLLRELLDGTSGLRCLATARESLEIEGAESIELSGLSLSHAAVQETGRDVREPVPSAPDEELFLRTDAGRMFVERASDVNPDFELSGADRAAALKLVSWLEGVPDSIERAAQLMDRFTPSAVLDELEKRLVTIIPASGSPGVEKLKEIMRSGAQKVRQSVEEAARTPSNHIGRLIQGVANIATDRKNETDAAELGRQSLAMSQEAGDDLGMADALRQLARLKAQQGDHNSARAMLAASAQLYRRHGNSAHTEVQRELSKSVGAGIGVNQSEDDSAAQEQVATAVDLAMKMKLKMKETH